MRLFVGKFLYQADAFPKYSLYHTGSSEKMPHFSHVGKPRFQAPFIMAKNRPKIQHFQTRGWRVKVFESLWIFEPRFFLRFFGRWIRFSFVFRLNLLATGLFLAIFHLKTAKMADSVSSERLIIWRWLITHFNQKTNFPIGVWYNVYWSEKRKWLKLPFWQKRAEKGKISYLINYWLYKDVRPLVLIKRLTFIQGSI